MTASSASLRQEWPGLLVAAASAALSLGGAWAAPTRLAAGGAWTEAPGHLVGLWLTARGLWEHGPLWRVDPGMGWPDGFSGHLIDPASLLPFLPGWWLAGGGVSGAVLGWNLLHLASALLGCLGSWALARRVAGDAGPWVRAAAMGAWAFAPYWLAHPWIGRTEYLVLALLPGTVAALLAFVQDGRRSRGLLAALGLGLCGLNVGYGGVFAALLVVPLGLALLATGPDRGRRLLRLALVAAGALLVALPGALALLADADVRARIGGGQAIPPPRPALCLLLRSCAPADLSRLLEQPLVLGWVSSGLTLIGAALAPRRGLAWLALAAWLVLWGLDVRLSLSSGTVLTMPAAWAVQLLPALAAVKEWSRIGTVLPVVLVPGVALGLHALASRLPSPARPVLALLALAGIAADGLTYPRDILAERPALDPAAPSELQQVLAALPDGPVLPLPVELQLDHAEPIQPGFHVLHHLDTGRPVSATVGSGVDVTAHWSGLTAWTLALRSARLHGQPEPRMDGPCLLANAAVLGARGYVGLVVDTAPAAMEEIAARLEDALGPPTATAGSQRAWALPNDDPDARGCPLVFEGGPRGRGGPPARRRPQRPQAGPLGAPAGP